MNGKSDDKMASSVIPTIIHILLQFNDIIFIQEHWLFHTQLHLLGEINEHINYVDKGVDKNDMILPICMPRGYGGVAIL